MAATAQIKFTLTKKNYDQIIDMAGYGIAYWAAYMESTDNGCHFTEDRTGKKFFITFEDMEKAVLGIHVASPLNDYHTRAIAGLVNDGCAGDVGSDIADAIVQWACFGKVIYG